MAKEKIDLSDSRNAEGVRNRTALIGLTIMNIVLAVAYFLEVVKHTRNMGSYAVIALLCVLPTVLSIAEYFRKKDSHAIRYISSIGFIILYSYVMFTTSSDLTFCYVLVFFVIQMVYTDMRLSIVVAVIAFFINVTVTVKKLVEGSLVGVSLTNAEIMLACVLLTCMFLILSISKIVQINNAGYEKAEEEKAQSEELLQAIFRVSSVVTENIGKAAEETKLLKESIGLTQHAMEELVCGTNDTVNAIVDQKGSTDRIDLHIQEVGESVTSITTEIRSAEDRLDSSNVVMKELLEQVQVSESSGELAANKMTELSEAAVRMQDILNLISNVADQTSLLALNASIEAARAGEAGRGFAVVASEISSLAAQTNNATADINQLIVNVSKSIGEVAEAMNTLLESSRLQSQYVDNTAENFRQIHHSTQNIVEQAKQLETIVDVVKTENKQVIEKIENVSAVTQEVTAGANETLESSTDNLESIEKVAVLMTALGEAAEELQSNYLAK